MNPILAYVVLFSSLVLNCQAFPEPNAVNLQPPMGLLSPLPPLQALPREPPITYNPDLFKSQSFKSKPNKVSSLLHYLHNMSNKAVYDPKQAENVDLIAKKATEQPDYRMMTDEQVLKSLCSERLTSVCEKAIRGAQRREPAHLADIVQAIRNKPQYVSANKLLWHKLFEKAITKAEEKNYDEKLNFALNAAVATNPSLRGLRGLSMVADTVTGR